MKKQLLLFITSVSVQFAIAQSPVTLSATSGTTVPSPACFACAGSIWNNEANVSLADGIPSDIDLMQNGTCFQSTCYSSRSLESSQFGFSIPGTAIVLGIEVRILREAPAVNIIKDTLVQLLRAGTFASSNYKSAVLWPTAYTTEVYGGPTDLWGILWNATTINDPATAVDLKIYNLSASSVSGVNVDQVSMTVYYSTATGIVQSQTSVPNSFSIFQTGENEFSVSFITSESSSLNKLNVYDISGKLVYSKNLGAIAVGEHQETISTNKLQKGIYLITIQNDKGVRAKKVMKD
jgi:hypothetical protein